MKPVSQRDLPDVAGGARVHTDPWNPPYNPTPPAYPQQPCGPVVEVPEEPIDIA